MVVVLAGEHRIPLGELNSLLTLSFTHYAGHLANLIFSLSICSAIYLFIYLLTHQIFIEHLLCAKHCSRH